MYTDEGPPIPSGIGGLISGANEERSQVIPKPLAQRNETGARPVDIVWNGITRPEALSPEDLALRQGLADAAKLYDWPRVFEMVAKNRDLINCSRPGGSSLFAPLHQAAHGGAPVKDVRRLITLGAWRTLRTAQGERPVDIARRKGHDHLLKALEPVYKHRVPPEDLLAIQEHFHTVIRGRAEDLVREHCLRLPVLEPLLELKHPEMWFTVPGMCGGFSYWLELKESQSRLISESWCRVVGGSGQRHVVTTSGSELVERGFV